ncbi:MAG TPA: hypothetical protein VND43_03190 [Burkholderiales bacterium]|nr:hypothetical protein [Burkholderiales bacterium]
MGRNSPEMLSNRRFRPESEIFANLKELCTLVHAARLPYRRMGQIVAHRLKDRNGAIPPPMFRSPARDGCRCATLSRGNRQVEPGGGWPGLEPASVLLINSTGGGI